MPAKPKKPRGKPPRPDLERGQQAYAKRAWADAYEALAKAEAEAPLEPADLNRLAWSLAMLGRDQEFIAALERLHALCVRQGDGPQAAHAAFWLGLRLLSLGEPVRAGGWFGTAQRLRGRDDEALAGWLNVPELYRCQHSGAYEQAWELAERVAAAGERAGDVDLTAFGRAHQGATRLRQGRVREALALFDEAMLIATRRQLKPLITGLIYCTVIAGCRRVYALERAKEWTGELGRWCEAQPQLVTFTGTCQVHRAEILELEGDWSASFEQARRVPPRDAMAIGAGHYQAGEIHRLRGEHAAAEEAYEAASRAGRDPQPGLALLRLAQGRTDAAVKGLARVLQGTPERLMRIRFLPAQVEVLLAAGRLPEAAEAAAELEKIAAVAESSVLEAMAAHARGAVTLAQQKPALALPLLRRALTVWLDLGAPYLAARVRVLVAKACRALGDADGERLEREAAEAVFKQLGAVSDLRQLAPPARGGGKLTGRELEVLRLVASGLTNGAIAGRLSLSEKTVDRHVSNIFSKLDVSTRTAATAHAFREGLV